MFTQAMAETDNEAFKAIVEDTWITYSAAMNAGDADLWISLWDQNGVQMPPNAPAVYGRQVIKERIRKGYQSTDYKEFTINLEETQVAGDWGFARGTYSLSLTPRAGGDTLFYEGKYLTIFKKQADGSWKIFRDCFNSNAPPQ
jgi:ketosteroid isomerase-like protein